MRLSVPRLLLAAAVGAVVASPLAAQTTSGAERAPAANALSINPLYLPFGGFVVEYERAASPLVSIGLSGGYYDPVGDGNDNYQSAEAKVRFYPNERAPRGFSVGFTVGVAHAHDDESDCCVVNGDADGTGATAGVLLDYNWLLGRSRRFLVGTGVGAKRLFGDVGDGDLVDIEVLPTVRIQVGVAF